MNHNTGRLLPCLERGYELRVRQLRYTCWTEKEPPIPNSYDIVGTHNELYVLSITMYQTMVCNRLLVHIQNGTHHDGTVYKFKAGL